MAYGQKNYADIQGINGKYRINQIGCLLTSFCNLLERYGMPVDPPTLNRIFIQRGIYLDVDDGIRDDLGWQSVTAYNGQIVTTVKSGGVTDRNSIVRLAASNSFGTHFCLVDSIRADGVYIVDSWDGAVKHHNTYGPITGWAVYTHNKPQPVGGDMPIPDADNYYWRYGQKLAEQVRGRQLSRAEFSQHIAGKTDLRAVEILSDDPEADRALDAQRLGQLAQRDNWQGQIYGLQAQVAELGKRPTQEQLDALNKQVGDLTTSVQQAHDEVEKTKAELEEAKKNQDGFTQADRDNQNKILGMVQSIFDYFKGQYKSFLKYVKKEK